MNKSTILRTAFFVLLVAMIATAAAKTPPTYQKGTITGWENQYQYQRAPFSNHKKYYDLKGSGVVYQIDCGPFQIGQAVDYRVEERVDGDEKVYIRGENGEEQKCGIASEKTIEGAKTDGPSAAH